MMMIEIEPEKITGKVLNEYLKTHCGTLRCPACRTKGPASIIAPSADQPARLFSMERTDGSGPFIFYLVTCEKCGYMWQFAADKVILWAMKMEEEGKAGEQ